MALTQQQYASLLQEFTFEIVGRWDPGGWLTVGRNGLLLFKIEVKLWSFGLLGVTAEAAIKSLRTDPAKARVLPERLVAEVHRHCGVGDGRDLPRMQRAILELRNQLRFEAAGAGLTLPDPKADWGKLFFSHDVLGYGIGLPAENIKLTILSDDDDDPPPSAGSTGRGGPPAIGLPPPEDRRRSDPGASEEQRGNIPRTSSSEIENIPGRDTSAMLRAAEAIGMFARHPTIFSFVTPIDSPDETTAMAALEAEEGEDQRRSDSQAIRESQVNCRRSKSPAKPQSSKPGTQSKKREADDERGLRSTARRGKRLLPRRTRSGG